MGYNILIVGSGIAGMYFALKASEFADVTILTKKKVFNANTYYAQGGVAAVLGEEDSFDKHIEDTLTVGDGLSKREIVELVVKDAPLRIRDLEKFGVSFTTKKNFYHLGREGGHSERRIVHAGDITGREILKALYERVLERKNIRILEDHFAIDLITKKKFYNKDPRDECYGIYVMDAKTKKIFPLSADAVVLATGGIGKTYLITSNAETATGDGIAMAARAGIPIVNMEFVQFHPTILYHPLAGNFLISEALRGEGGILRLKDGTRFMEKYHPMKDLAPRDIVARAIDTELKKTGDECVYLDMTHLGKAFLQDRFPNIYKRCKELGIDMAEDPIPVVPGAHYLCGGVCVGPWGETIIQGLYTLGESSYTGLHGANRLASNSLLEAMVFAKRCSEHLKEYLNSTGQLSHPELPPWEFHSAKESDEAVVILQNWDEIRRLMWNYVGIVRSDRRLERARRRIDIIKQEVNEYYWNFLLTPDLLELRNVVTVAELIVESALRRKESRGTHYNINYPYKDDVYFKSDTIIRRIG